jgi:hydrogenase maturation protease
MSEPISLLVLGLGNLLCSDDGLGSAAVARLESDYEAPPGVRVMDGGTLGLSLLPYLEDSDQAILVDAIRAEGEPGTFVRLSGEEVAPAVRDRLSPHQVGVSDLLEGAHWRERYPRRVVLLGLVPETLELGVARSASVEAGLPELVERILEEARNLGYEFRPKAPDLARSRGSQLVASLFGL